jgi:hypothetical protein
MEKRPYNHSDNVLPNGQPKHSESVWDLMESLRAGIFPSGLDYENPLTWPNGTPNDIHDAVCDLANRVSSLEEGESTFENPLTWPNGIPTSAGAAINDLSVRVSSLEEDQPTLENPMIWPNGLPASTGAPGIFKAVSSS